MSNRPTETIGWATNQVNESVQIGGNNILVTNKVEPTQELKDSGVLAREKWARPYMNWLFWNIYQWVLNLDTRDNFVGVIKIANNTAGRTAADYEAEFSGDWVLRGTDTLAGETVDIFERVA